MEAIIGSSKRSVASVRSGLLCWVNFAGRVMGKVGRELPPSLDGLLAWSNLFRCSATFGNYLSHVRLACEIARVSTDVFDHPSLTRAKRSIDKRCLFQSRSKQFIGFDLLTSLVESSVADGQGLEAALYVLAYAFLLRVPSEALPILVSPSTVEVENEKSVLSCDGVVLRLRLAFRKNQARPTTMERACWCARTPLTCPVHMAWPLLAQCTRNVRPFTRFTPAYVLRQLRLRLSLEVADAMSFRTHDLRRGHARDLQNSGASLAEVLRAGQWRSPAFMSYLDVNALERDVVVQAHVDDSSGDDE